VGVARAVEDEDTRWKPIRELAVGGRYPLVERGALALEPILEDRPLRGELRLDEEEDGAVGHQTLDGVQVQLEHVLYSDAAGDPLVREGGVDVAIGDDDRTARERRLDHRLDELGSRRCEQPRLGPGRHCRPVEHELADALADLRAAGLTREHHIAALGRERVAQQLRLRRLPRPVHSLESDEHARPTIRRVRAIVTGGAGFIGSHVVEALLARGDEVHVLDDLSKGTRENVPADAKLHVADIREPDAVLDAVRPEAVFHFAAQADVRFSVERPAVDAEMNVFGTLQILEGARRHGAQVVLASTGGAVYGECDGPATESSPRRPLSPYGTSKLAAEEYLATYNRLYGTGHVSLRFANVYGPRQIVHGEAGVIAIFTGLLRDGGTPLIYGDGTQTRDYVYVGDVARATLAAAGKDGGVFNIGTGIETSVLELYDALARASGVTRPPEHAPARLGELRRSVLDVSLAARELAWTPQVTLEEGLLRTWEWATR